jgi:hypothetical protein
VVNAASLKRIPILLHYARFRLWRRCFGALDFYAVAHKRWVIAPAEDLVTPASITLADEFERIGKVEHGSTLDIERRRTIGGVFSRPPVCAYQFRDAILFQGSVFAHNAEKRVLPYGAKPPPSSAFPVVETQDAALCGSYLGLTYFGHWLKDDAPLSLLADAFGTPLSPSPPAWHAAQFADSHIGGYVKLLNLPWRQAENAICRSLVVIDDEDFTTHKAKRLEALRGRMRARIGPTPAGRRVFIRRGVPDAGPRLFHNENLVIEALAADGFEVLDPSQLNVEELARALSGADLVVGVEGSHQVHAIFSLRAGAGLLAITPPQRFTTVNKRWTDLLGIRYGYLVGEPESEGFRVDIDRLRRTIDLF